MRTSTESVLKSAILSGIFAYWMRLKGGKVIPLRSQVDPIEIQASILPHLFLSEYDRASQSVRHRVVGTSFADYLGRDITGLELREVVNGDYLEFIQLLFSLSADNNAPILSNSRFRWDLGRTLDTSRLLLPLSKDGSKADMSLGAQVFENGVGPQTPQVFIYRSDGWEDLSSKFSHFGVDAIYAPL